MTQNNIFMEDENSIIYLDVLPDIQDTVTEAASSATSAAASAEASKNTALTLVDSIRGIKTGVETFVAQALESLRDLYSNISTAISTLGDTTVQNINSVYSLVVQRIRQTEEGVLTSIRTLGSEYVNDARNYAQAAQEIVDFHVSTDHLNQSKGLKTGDISDDSVMLSNVRNYAHSTFDKSKFTIVGSPVITDDGIVSGFSKNNYVVSNGTFDFNSADSWEIINKFKVTSFDHVQFFGGVGNSSNFGCTINIDTNKRMVLYVSSDGANWDISNGISSSLTLNVNIDYYVRRAFSGTAYTVDISTDGETWTNYITVNSSTKIYSGAVSVCIGFYAGLGNNDREVLGSIDLKQFSITVDGVPYFSGNKTGIDTIKADDYTEEGSVTFTPDGIASGFSTGNYLTNNITLGSGEWEIIIPYNTASTNLSSGIIFYTSACGVFYYNNDIYLNVKDASSNNILNGHFTPNTNTNYLFRLSYKNGTYKGEYSTDKGATYSSLDANTTSSIARNAATSQIFYIGGNTSSASNGSINLNAFKIYVDGDLVYQPCLKIPYTKSAPQFGSKIVNAVYRDRIEDAYSQGYPQRYYTLSDTDFTLPKGEIYGMIEQLRSQIEELSSQIL